MLTENPKSHTHLFRVLATWGPVLLLLALIFAASAQPKHGPPPGAGDLYFSGAMPVFTARLWEFAIKKGAHMASYGALAVLLLRALRVHAVPVREAALLAVLFAMTYGLMDEIHQGFVPGRNASVIDLGFDTVGAILAVLLAYWIRSAGNRSCAASALPGQYTGRGHPAEPPA
ncbi:MAG: VanZ family protein [Anaerolineae bacterium]|nr:VanZ family protein [Anaerolineae bacterium]